MYDRYESPFSTRYASKEMQYLFSAEKKFSTWRKLWVALAESEMELGLPITESQIKEMKDHINDINYSVAESREKNSPRCNGPRLCVRATVPVSHANNPFRSNLLLRHRQHGYHNHVRSP